MPETSPHSWVPKTLEEFTGSETIVGPPRNDEVPNIGPQGWHQYGKNCLVIFPTGNKHKVEALKAHFNSNEKPSDVNSLLFEEIPVSDNGCSQPCNDQGRFRAEDRIMKAMDKFRSGPEYKTYLEDKHIGTVFIAVIESFFEKKNGQRPVDAALIVLFNVSTGRTVTRTTDGTTLNQWFLDEAERREGHVDGNKDCLCMTAGKIVAERVHGVDAANWHEYAVGKPRKEFFEEALKPMGIPYAATHTETNAWLGSVGRVDSL
ncbi:hypothetical protein FLAG1_11611 [Fusarium langsethiae]|uniref:Non-canonical purine NTP phosphatase/PRRC1 domain-containing protein n=1 Tax=Fusarium langsethiae TaxID=179993 RepID=A0A0N0V4Q3_FUSLA|nr:hypothetical protein FLAG1_11611 [Fusarium langsethiae]GKU11247.1 unnamed protein product [Fusarium langsethiae]GKU14035.1 unnamed protein product [Fusarium langsethiae]